MALFSCGYSLTKSIEEDGESVADLDLVEMFTGVGLFSILSWFGVVFMAGSIYYDFRSKKKEDANEVSE